VGIISGRKIAQDVVKSIQQWQYKVTGAKKSSMTMGKLEFVNVVGIVVVNVTLMCCNIEM
jgi:hypothetical protein